MKRTSLFILAIVVTAASKASAQAIPQKALTSSQTPPAGSVIAYGHEFAAPEFQLDGQRILVNGVQVYPSLLPLGEVPAVPVSDGDRERHLLNVSAVTAALDLKARGVNDEQAFTAMETAVRRNTDVASVTRLYHPDGSPNKLKVTYRDEARPEYIFFPHDRDAIPVEESMSKILEGYLRFVNSGGLIIYVSGGPVYYVPRDLVPVFQEEIGLARELGSDLNAATWTGTHLDWQTAREIARPLELPRPKEE